MIICCPPLARIAYITRQLKNKKQVERSYIRSGRVFVKVKADDEHGVEVATERDLKELLQGRAETMDNQATEDVSTAANESIAALNEVLRSAEKMKPAQRITRAANTKSANQASSNKANK